MPSKTIHLNDGSTIRWGFDHDRGYWAVVYRDGVGAERLEANGTSELLTVIAESRILGGPGELVDALVWMLDHPEEEPPEQMAEWVEVIRAIRALPVD